MSTDTPPGSDPFAEFDAAAGIGAVRDPYPVWAELRAQTPVYAGSLAERFGVASVEDALLTQTPYTPLTFAAVQQILRDGETFSSAGYANTIGLVFGHSILEMDEPEHHAYRALIQ